MPPAKSVVNHDAGPLRLAGVGDAIRLTLERRETNQPRFVAVEPEVMVLRAHASHHGRAVNSRRYWPSPVGRGRLIACPH